jgi:hypothetical protein
MAAIEGSLMQPAGNCIGGLPSAVEVRLMAGAGRRPMLYPVSQVPGSVDTPNSGGVVSRVADCHLK